MKIERTKNATRNIIFGIFLKLYQIIIPFFMRTAMIYFLGMEYVGLDSLFISILQILNMAELGVGSAMVFSMYKPIADDDNVQICALMRLYKIYYRIIGTIILVIGMVLCPFIPNLIKSELPSGLNIYILYILNLLSTVLSYWLFAYKSSVLQAFQRVDIISKITLIVYTIRYIFQFIILFIYKNYYLYLIITLLSQIFLNIITAIVVDKLYPDYKAEGKLEKQVIKDINQRVKDLFTSKVGGIIINSADTVVISAFLGLTILAIYQNYYYIITAVIGIIGVFFTACSAGIGNSLVSESKDKNYNDFKKFTFIILTLSTICTSLLLSLFQPFMTWWVGEEFLLEFSAVICLCIYFYIYEFTIVLSTYKDAAGIWHKDRYRALITSFFNLILNLILVNYIGIYGVLLSTVLSLMLIGVPWLLYNIFSEIFNKSIKEYLIKIFGYFITTIICIVISYFVTNLISGTSIFIILCKACVCTIISLVVWCLIYANSTEMKEMINLMERVVKRKEEII